MFRIVREQAINSVKGTSEYVIANIKRLRQKNLRDIKFELEILLANVNKYLDVRNEQGRKWVRSSKSEVKK